MDIKVEPEPIKEIPRPRKSAPAKVKQERLPNYLDDCGISYDPLPGSTVVIAKHGLEELHTLLEKEHEHVSGAGSVREYRSKEGKKIRVVHDKVMAHTDNGIQFVDRVMIM